MVSKTEKNRIIRLKRQANYLRARAESSELTKKQQTHAQATANALSWAISMAITAIEHREKDFVHDRKIDRIVSILRRRKFKRNQRRYERVEEEVRELFTADIMDHEKTFDGLATQLERQEAVKPLKDKTQSEVEIS